MTITRHEAEAAGWGIEYRDKTRRWVARRGLVGLGDGSIDRLLEQIAAHQDSQPTRAQDAPASRDEYDLRRLRESPQLRAEWRREVDHWIATEYLDEWRAGDDYKPSRWGLEMQRRNLLLSAADNDGPESEPSRGSERTREETREEKIQALQASAERACSPRRSGTADVEEVDVVAR